MSKSDAFQKYLRYVAEAERELGVSFTHKVSEWSFSDRLESMSPDEQRRLAQAFERPFSKAVGDTLERAQALIDSVRNGSPPPELLDLVREFPVDGPT